MNEVLSRGYDVCMITTRHPLKDHRVYHKEAVSLAQRLGLRVLVLAIAERDVVVDEGRIAIVGIQGSQRDVLKSVLRIARVLVRIKARVFHIHDFEDLALVPVLKHLRRATVVYDVHEDYSLMVRHVVALPDVLRAPLALIVDRYERFLSRQCDEVILVEEPQRARFRRFGVDDASMIVVRNLVSLRGFEPKGGPKHFDLVYCGTCTATRGLYELVDAIAYAKRGARPLTLSLMLSGKPDEITRLRAHVESRGVSAETQIRTHVPYDEVAAGLSRARVGVVLFHDVAKYRTGIPTKLHEYGAAGLPTLSNDVNLHAVEHLERWSGGVIVHGLTPEAIIEGVERIDADYAAMSERARRAALENCWEAEEAKLLDLYRKLLAPPPL